MENVRDNIIEDLEIDQSNWGLVKFGDVAIQQKQKVDRDNTDLTKYVKGEHMYSEDLHLRKWGELKDEYLGPAFIRKFEKDDILYGSRRTYLRKVVIAPFSGITSNTTFVIKANEDNIDKRLLPFVMMSEGFTENSIRNSKGSVNPYINWKDIANYEFLLPPKDQQAQLAELLWAMDEVVEREKSVEKKNKILYDSFINEVVKELKDKYALTPLESIIDESRPITYGILKPGKGYTGGIPVIKVRDYPNGNIIEEDLLLTSPEIEAPYKRSRLKTGDLLLSIRGTVGRLTEVPKILNGANITQDTARLAIISSINHLYVRTILESNFIQRQIKIRTTGLAVQGINLGEVRKLMLPIPDISTQNKVALKLRHFQDVIHKIKVKINSSKALQKSLINQIF